MRFTGFKYLKHIMIAIMLIFVVSCGKDEPADVQIDEINEFIWKAMKDYYLWVDNIPSLNNADYDDRAKLAEYVNTYTDHEAFFETLIYNRSSIDKWSWIVDDYVALEQYFQGITTSMGYDFGVVAIDNSNDVYAYVQYVVPDGPADLGGIQRGEIINRVNGTTLTRTNYLDLLYNNSSYTAGFADFDGDNLVSNAKEVSLTAVEVHENPVHHSEVIDVDGKKVGYLVYNAFRSNYDLELNTAIGDFATAGIEELIIDLRYNGGGHVSSAIHMSSMIYDATNTDIFTIYQFNTFLHNYYEKEHGADYFNIYFRENISQNDVETPIQTLDLPRVYFLTTNGSASASELVINGLKPYVDVVLVGSNTHGKYVGSFTLKDYISEDVVNPNHKWALQPIVFKLANSQGVSDFVNGFTPDVIAAENYRAVLPFGDPNEPMLKAAIDHIKGQTTQKDILLHFDNLIGTSKDAHRFSKEMIIDRK